MSVERKNRISGEESKQQNRVKIRHMVRNINTAPRDFVFLKLDVTMNLKQPEQATQAKTNKILQIFSPES